MSYAFEEKVLASQVPLQPTAGEDFQAFFGYYFAKSLNEHNWGPEATPSHMVTTYPVALQRAWEQVGNMDSTWTWWNQAYDTMPMADIYVELLHKTVDLACKQNEWSHKNQVALHKYADAFIQEAQNPQFNIMNQMARQIMMSHVKVNGTEAQQAFVTMTADMMAQQLPNHVTFNEVYCVDGWMSVLMEDFAEAHEEAEELYGEHQAVEIAFCRVLAEHSQFESYQPSEADETPARFDAWRKSCIELISGILDFSHIKIEELVPFREDKPGVNAFFGEATERYLQLHPELVEQFRQEEACFWHSAGESPDSSMDDAILRGFCTPTPLAEESFDIIEDIMRNLSLAERQFFLHQFEFSYGLDPAHMVSAITLSFKFVEDRFGKIPDMEAALTACIEMAQEHDIAFQEQYANQDVTYGGYQFTQQYAEYYAQGLQDVFNGLPVKMRAEFAKAFDDAMSAGDEIKAAKAAFLTLPEDAQTALKADFERAYDSLEYDAMDRDWDD